MKRENWFIYVGTAIFILLAIALGIIMYMLTKTDVNPENNGRQVGEVSKEIEQETESVTTEIGKTVEEQENNNNESGVSQENTTIETNTTSEEPEENQQATTLDEPDTQVVENAGNQQPEEEVTETKKEITFVKPTEGEVICEYAKDNLIYSETLKEWITHTGVDIKADKTSVIKSATDGVIKSIINDPRYGLTVVITHDEGYETVYSNLLTAEFVVEGEEVAQGQTIGTAGNTATFESAMESHVHFELLKDGEYLDPSIYLKQ